MSDAAPCSPDGVPSLDELPLGVLSIDDDGIVVAANAALHEMLGYPPGALVGVPAERAFTVGGRIFLQTHLLPLVRMAGRAEELFVLLRAADGTDVGALVNVSRGARDGRAVIDFALMRVRERRKFEDALLRARREAEESRAEAEARSRDLHEANELLEQQAVELEIGQQQLMEQATELEQQAEQLQALNDEMIVRTHDMEQARAEAERANRAKSDFLAVMSHELRTPLNAIGGYAQLLDLGIHGPVTEAQQEALARILLGQRLLLRTINDILNFARLDAGSVEYARDSVSLSDVVRTTLPMIEPQAAQRGLSLGTEVPETLVACADAEKVEQVVINLLANAVKFTSAGRVLVIGGGDDERVRLTVRDTGRGIPPAKLAQVFEPFVRVDVSHTRTTEGAGLGLAISRNLARGMGGDLTAESTPDVGSSFTLTLPRA